MLKNEDVLSLYETYLNARILSICQRVPSGAVRAAALKQIKELASKYLKEEKISSDYYNKTFSAINILELSVCVPDIE